MPNEISQNIKTFVDAAKEKNAALVREALINELKAKSLTAIESAKNDIAKEFFTVNVNNV